MGISAAGLVAEATHSPVEMSSSDTFTEEEPMSMPKLFMAVFILWRLLNYIPTVRNANFAAKQH